jgi:hypothetical protein
MTMINNDVMPTYDDTISANEIDHHSPDSFRYAVEVHKPLGVLDLMLEWCRREMTDAGWRWQLVSTSGLDVQGRYIFYFNNEQDYFLFVLRWR